MRDTDDGLHLYLDQYTDAQLNRLDRENRMGNASP
jgi:hypothetical protein